MTDIELAYFAGLFDGEGCIQIGHNKPQKRKRTEQHTLNCKVAMTNKQAVNSYLIFGGSVCVKQASLKNPNWKDQYVWAVNSNMALHFLEIILPYLKLKREEAQCGIEFQRFRTPSFFGKPGGGRRYISQEELNKREWYRQELRRLKESRFPERSWHNDERTKNKERRRTVVVA